MQTTSRTPAHAAPDAGQGEMIGVGYVRIPAPQLDRSWIFM